MVVCKTACSWLNQPIEEIDPQAVIIVGNLSVPAMRYMESHGTRIEEINGLFYITLPYGCDVGKWNEQGGWRYTTWSIQFDSDGGETETKPGAMNIVIESELVAFESRCYAVPIPIVDEKTNGE